MPVRRSAPKHLFYWRLALWIGSVLTVALFYWLVMSDQSLVRAAGTIVGVAGAAGLFRASWALNDREEAAAHAQARAAFNAIMNEGQEFIVYGTRGYWPVALALLAITCGYVVALPELTPRVAALFPMALPLAVWFWIQVAPRLFPPLIIFAADGFTTRNLGKVRWAEVAGVSLAGWPVAVYSMVKGGPHGLVIEFADSAPRAGAGWYRRYIRGIGDHDEHIDLVNSSEPMVFTRTLAEFLVESAESERVKASTAARFNADSKCTAQ